MSFKSLALSAFALATFAPGSVTPASFAIPTPVSYVPESIPVQPALPAQHVQTAIYIPRTNHEIAVTPLAAEAFAGEEAQSAASLNEKELTKRRKRSY